jgi:ATP-binding cassette subfamily B protein/subfamily B ATP-binding cassette protein MsbA
MKNFWKAIRDSLRYTPAIVLATLCSIGIALIWSSNITALYPVIDMTLKGESIQNWLEKKIAASEATIQSVQLERLQILNADANASTIGLTQKIDEESSYNAWNKFYLSWANSVFPRDPFQTICYIMGLLVCSTLVKHLLMLANDMLIGYVSTNIVRGLRTRVFDTAMHMDKTTYQSFGTSGLLAAITSAAEGLSSGLIAVFGAAIREPLRVIACLAAAFCICPRLLMLSVVLTPLLIVCIVYFNRKIRSIASSILGRNAGFHEVLLEALSNVFTVQAFTMEKHENERFRACTKDMRRASMKMIFYTGLSKPFTELIGIGMVAITVCAGAYLVVNKQTHIGFLQICETPLGVPDLLIFFGLLIGASDPLRKLSGISVIIYSGAMAANLLYGIIDSKPKSAESSGLSMADRRHEKIAIRDICFHYHTSHPVLQNVNLDIPFGKTVVILGPNGSGKSTLIQLLGRYYEPVSGSIHLDDVDLRSIPKQAIRSKIALVSQSTELFNRSVLENIRYGSPNASKDEVVEAAIQAHAHQFICESLSEGYETVVGQGGQKLSGGQRQRIALARAILRKPEILILDESTSQIDMESELQIRETLQQMKGSMTIIIITHREALTALADEVYTIQNGRLISSQHKLAAA